MPSSAARTSLQGGWGQMLPRERGRLLRRLGELIETHSERLIATEITRQRQDDPRGWPASTS